MPERYSIAKTLETVRVVEGGARGRARGSLRGRVATGQNAPPTSYGAPAAVVAVAS